MVMIWRGLTAGLVKDEVVSHRPEQDAAVFRQILPAMPSTRSASQEPECLDELNQHLAGNPVPGLFNIVVPNLREIFLSGGR